MPLSRRDFLKTLGIAAAGSLVPWEVSIPRALAANVGPASPKMTPFVDKLIATIPVLTPISNPAYPGADYYEIEMKGGRWQFHSQMPVTSTLQYTTWGYFPAGQGFLGYLGPSIEAKKSCPAVVKFINQLPVSSETLPNHPVPEAVDPTIMGNSPDDVDYGPVGRTVPHLHGGFTPPQFDGHPLGWFAANGAHGGKFGSLDTSNASSAVYWYSNQQDATMLWYHDHAFGITRLNAYAGLAALYFVRDELDTGQADNPLGLPAGPYEVPLVIQDKQFNADGSLYYPTVGVSPDHPIWVPEFFGDTPVINAVAYPYLNVEPRRYRFRMVNGSQARFYNMWLEDPKKNVRYPLWVIGMEQGLLPKAVQLPTLLLAPGERADVIFDFSQVPAGSNLILKNNAKAPYPGGQGGAVSQLIQFRVGKTVTGGKDLTTPPSNLKLPAITPLATQGVTMREIVMKELMSPVTGEPIEVKLNEHHFEDAVEETPKVGSTEVWQFINLTVDAHPMHMHLVRFQVVNRQPFDAKGYSAAYMAWVGAGRDPSTKPVLSNYFTGAPVPPAPEESGWKDTAKSYPGQILRVAARFDLPDTSNAPTGAAIQLPAEYVYHCHILEHEENDMMRPFQVVAS